MVFLQSLIFVTVAINLLLATVVIFDNYKGKLNRLFVLFSLTLSAWMLSNFLENEPFFIGKENLELFLRLDFALAIFVLYSLFLFCITLAQSKLTKLKFVWLRFGLILATIGLSLLSLATNLIIKNVSFYDGIIHFKDGLLLPVYGLFILIFSITGLVVLFIARQKAKLNKDLVYKRQIDFIFFGLLLSLGNAIIINLFLQTILPISLQISRLGLYGMGFLTVFIALAVLRHHLMNISVVVTELLVSALLLLVLAPLFNIQEASSQPSDYLFSVVVFLGTAFFSIFLIKHIRKDAKHKEELFKLTVSLEKANSLLQAVDKQKTEFLSIASHQLRTPLSVLKGYIELLREGAYGKMETKAMKVLGDMDVNNEHLIKLVDEFLDISRIEQGRAKYNFNVVNIYDLVNSAINNLKARAKQKTMDIKLATEKTVERVDCDSEKIHHVIYNFIDNAVKYSDKGTIKILFEKEGEGVAVSVFDQGIGFEKKDGINFYQKFYRGDNVKATAVNGTGLGLYVCRKFIEGHNGRVWAHSAGLGKGSEFGFWIPLSHEAVPSEPAKPLAQ